MLPILIHAFQEVLTRGGMMSSPMYETHLWIGDGQALLKKDNALDWQQPLAQKLLFNKIESAVGFTFGDEAKKEVAYRPLTHGEGNEQQWRALVVFLKIGACYDSNIKARAVQSSEKWLETTGQAIHLLTQNDDLNLPVNALLLTVDNMRNPDDYCRVGMLDSHCIEDPRWAGLGGVMPVLVAHGLDGETPPAMSGGRIRTL